MSKRLCAALLALMLSLLIPCALSESASAELPRTLYVTSTVASVYRSPSGGARKLATLSFGESVCQVGAEGADWAILKNAKGQTGYCALNSLSKTEPVPLNAAMYAQLKKTPVYAKAETSAKVLGKLERNDAVTVTAFGPEGDWVRVERNGRYGYIRRKDLDDAPYSQGTKAWCVGDAVAIAVAVSPSAWESVGLLSHGQSVTLLGEVDGCYKVRNARGEIGYVSVPGAITTEDPNTLKEIAYTQISGHLLRNRFGQGAKATFAPKNAEVTVLSVTLDGQYARILYRGKHYYVPQVFLSSSKRLRGRPTALTTDAVDVTAQPKIGSKTVLRLEKGAKVQLIKGQGLGAVQIRAVDPATGKTVTGWMLVSLLSKE